MLGIVHFVICISYLFGFCNGSVKINLKEDLLNAEKKVLEEELNRVNKEKCLLFSEINDLHPKIQKQTSDCLESLESRDITELKSKSKFPALVTEVNDLWVQKELIYQSKQLINETYKNTQKLELGTGVLNNEMISFQERRINGSSIDCLILEGLLYNERVVSVGFALPLRHEVLVKRNELLLAQEELFGLKLEKEELETRMRIDGALCKEKHRSLNTELEKLVALPREAALNVKKRLQVQVNEESQLLKDFHKDLKAKKEKLKWTQDALSADSDLAKYAMYAADKYCFDKIISDVFTTEVWGPDSKNDRYCREVTA